MPRIPNDAPPEAPAPYRPDAKDLATARLATVRRTEIMRRRLAELRNGGAEDVAAYVAAFQTKNTE